jgi:hypothetical protein
MTKPKEPTHQDWAKRFAVACGNEWHERQTQKELVCLPDDSMLCEFNLFYQCSCGKIGPKVSHKNPTYLNPADIIREVDKWPEESRYAFMCSVSKGITEQNKAGLDSHIHWYIDIDLITEEPPTRLLKEATLFKEGKK